MANRHSNGSLRSQFDGFGYDGVFNLTAMTTSNHILGAFDGVHTWQYDSKDRLTQEVNDQTGDNQPYDYTHAFAYDDAGNPTTFKGVTGGFNADNQQTSPGTFAYDGNGNPTTYKGAALTFDVENRMTSVQVGINAQSNGYRSDGLRAWKGWNVVLPQGENDAVALGTYFYYDGGFPVLETNASGTVTAINVFAPDGLVARKVSGAWRHYQFDAQGSVMHRLRDDETVINHSKYDAYGMHVSMPFPVADAFGYNGRWGYYTDDETGLILCMHRYYDADAGRWLTRDPIGYAGGTNLYAYCGGSPVGGMDPSGLIWETIADIVGIGVDIVEFARDPSLENGLMLGWSVGATIIPFVPGSWVKRAADGAGHIAKKVRILKQNVRNGALAEDAVEAAARQQGKNYVRAKKFETAKQGKRKYDFYECDEWNNVIARIEVKFGGAKRSKKQRDKDDWLSQDGIPVHVIHVPGFGVPIGLP